MEENWGAGGRGGGFCLGMLKEEKGKRSSRRYRGMGSKVCTSKRKGEDKLYV